MMAGKARLFHDERGLASVFSAASPKDANVAGRAVRGYSDEAWAAARFDLVVAGNLAKFRQDSDLAAFLCASGGRELVESSRRDRIWGIGMGASHPDATRPARWRGDKPARIRTDERA
jgi:ribA/ribD-fused uncharacterized protein